MQSVEKDFELLLLLIKWVIPERRGVCNLNILRRAVFLVRCVLFFFLDYGTIDEKKESEMRASGRVFEFEFEFFFADLE